MIKIDSEKTIEITRGDCADINISATNSDGSAYEFNVGDIVRLSVTEKNDVTNVILEADTTVTKASTNVDIILNSTQTRIGNYINKSVTYRYEIEINPDSNNSITIIGDDADGSKKFIIFPESKRGA